MLNKIASLLLILCSACAYSCNTPGSSDANGKKDSLRTTTTSGNKYSTSLREACEKLSKADNEKDSATYFSMLDSTFSITARGRTFSSRAELKAYTDKWMSKESQSADARNSYKIEKVAAGSQEPVWAGYESGTFENVAKSADGKYNRKVTGPYYRAWKLSNGAWKCYHVVFMAFTCEGNDCK